MFFLLLFVRKYVEMTGCQIPNLFAGPTGCANMCALSKESISIPKMEQKIFNRGQFFSILGEERISSLSARLLERPVAPDYLLVRKTKYYVTNAFAKIS